MMTALLTRSKPQKMHCAASPVPDHPPISRSKTTFLPSLLCRLSLFGFFLFLKTPVFAQSSTPDMADLMRSNGKIYVVVFVIITIFVGIIAYLIRLDNRIRRMEKEFKKEAHSSTNK